MQKANDNNSFSQANSHDHIIEVLLIGESGAGKTSLSCALTGDVLSSSYIHTLSVDVRTCHLTYDDITYQMRTWDTGGEERAAIITACRKSPDIILLVVNLADALSHDSIHNRLKGVTNLSTKEVPVILVGNQPRDPQYRRIADEDIIAIAEKYDLHYIKVNVFDPEQVKELLQMTLEISTLKLLNPTEVKTNASAIPMMFSQVLKKYNTTILESACSLEDYRKLLNNVNPLVICSRGDPKKQKKAYYTKIILMEKIFYKTNPYDNHDFLVILFIEYLDAIAGAAFYQAVSTNELYSKHLSILINLLEFSQSNPAWQQTILNLSNSYKDRPTHLFPIDSKFQSMIMCKIVGWIGDQPALTQLGMLRYLPYLGGNQLVIDNIVQQIILAIDNQANSDCDHNTRQSAVREIINYTNAQIIILRKYSSGADMLYLNKLRILLHCLAPHYKNTKELSSHLKQIESSIIAAPREIISTFIIELLKSQQENDGGHFYLLRLSLAEFIIMQYNFNQHSDLLNNLISQLDDAQKRLLQQMRQYIFQLSFGHLITDLEKNRGRYKLPTQTAVDAFNRCRQLENFELSLNQHQKEELDYALIKLLANTQRYVTENEDQLPAIAKMLSDFISKYWQITKIVERLQPLIKLENPLAQNICQYVIHSLLKAKKLNEADESYLERLSATANLFVVYPPMKDHFLARMKILVKAEEVVAQAAIGMHLTDQHFQFAFTSEWANNRQEIFKQFVSERPLYYLQALCRCYRQAPSLAVHNDELIQQFLITQEQGLVINNKDLDFLANIISVRLPDADIAKLIEELPLLRLKLLASYLFPRICQIMNNSLCNLSDESMVKLAKALILAIRYQDLIIEIQKPAFRIFNTKIFMFLTLILQEMSLKDENIPMAMAIIENLLNQFFNASLPDLCITLKTEDYLPVLSSLLGSIPRDCSDYNDKFVPVLNHVVFTILTEVLPKLHDQQQSEAIIDQCNKISCCLIEHGASILTPTSLKHDSNTALTLLASKYVNILTPIYKFFRNNQQAINDQEPDHYRGQNPLLLAIINGGNHQLIKRMLKLGFSTKLVDAILHEKHNPNSIQQADRILSNHQAMRALYLFRTPQKQNEQTDLTSPAITLS